MSAHEIWRELYEAADREKNRGLRLLRILEAQKAMLQYAWILEETRASDEECRELEQAAESLRVIKLGCQSA